MISGGGDSLKTQWHTVEGGRHSKGATDTIAKVATKSFSKSFSSGCQAYKQKDKSQIW